MDALTLSDNLTDNTFERIETAVNDYEEQMFSDLSFNGKNIQLASVPILIRPATKNNCLVIFIKQH
jgi:hypothetical protein